MDNYSLFCYIINDLQEKGAHIVKTDPSAEVVETYASSIGARSQSARTYLEKNMDEFYTGLLSIK